MPTDRDLGRRFYVLADASWNVFIRERADYHFDRDGVLPVFSTDTWAEADALRVRHCRLARDGSGIYTLTQPPDDVNSEQATAYLSGVTDMFRSTFEANRNTERRSDTRQVDRG